MHQAQALGFGPRLGFALSRNPREQRPDAVLQFVNLRIYEGDLSGADARVTTWFSMVPSTGVYLIALAIIGTLIFVFFGGDK